MSMKYSVSTEQLLAAASQFEASRTKCINLVRKMMNTCTGLKGSWQGEAAENYYKKLAGISGDLNDIQKIIEEHSKDLRAIEAEYKKAESNASQKVIALDNDVLSY